MTKVLLIEDGALLRGELTDWLMFEGFDVITAEDGIAGVDAALSNLPDLILCDITMPRLDGFGVLLEVHSHSSTLDIPFIFLTARAGQEDIRKGMTLGADDYLTKPFTRLELLQAIQTRLEKKAAQAQDHRREMEQIEQVLTQEREQRLLQTKLMAMISHDFRNPLATILSSNSLLRDYADRMDEKRRRTHMDRIEFSVHQLQQMLDDILIVAKMQTGNLDFKPDLLNVGAHFQSIVDEFQQIHGESHQIIFENHFSETVLADARLLRQIATNLISNAVKYSPQGGEVCVILDNPYKGQFVLTIQDQGIGISEADQEHLFETFQRGSNVGEVSGTGLGLAIVKQAVNLHEGSIRLESQIGIGTKVIVTIPFTE